MSAMRTPSHLRWFIAANRAICDRIEQKLPDTFKRNLLYEHALAVSTEISGRSNNPIVLDIGGGRDTGFIRYLPRGYEATIIGIDIQQSQLSANTDLDFGIVADTCVGLPLEGQSVDVAVTCSLLEHLSDPRVAIREIGRVLRPNGICIHVFPARFSPFSILNRFLPSRLARRLLFTFYPEWEHTSGFPAFYRHCSAGAMTRLHNQAGFEIKAVEYRYYQSIYYKFFVPFYLLSLSYDLLAYSIGLPVLACQILLTAKKRPSLVHV
jgi:SAM-dependent methyltransferase